MKNIIEIPLENAHSIYVEIDTPQQEGMQRAARPGEVLTKSTQTFENALEAIKPAINAIINKLSEYSTSVDQIEVEFGVKFSAKADVIIASVDSEANITVKLSWKRRE